MQAAGAELFTLTLEWCDRIDQGSGKLQVSSRICQIDHLLVVAQLKTVQAGADELGRKQVHRLRCPKFQDLKKWTI